MQTRTHTEKASELLWEHWQEGRRLQALPAQLRPATRAEGYAIQAELEKRSAAPLFGWKIAATSVAGQKHINVDGPIAGRILASFLAKRETEIRNALIENDLRHARRLVNGGSHGLDRFTDAYQRGLDAMIWPTGAEVPPGGVDQARQ